MASGNEWLVKKAITAYLLKAAGILLRAQISNTFT